MKKYLQIIILLHVTLLLLPGCLPRIERNLISRLYIDSTQPCEQKVYPNRDEAPGLRKQITVWVHGTRLFSKTCYTEVFDSTTGLKKAERVLKDPKFNTIATTLINYHNNSYNFDDFYFFGWPGNLCFQARQEAATFLYQELERISKEYERKFKHKPYIRVIAHSHGGNVTLNLAKVKYNNDVIINELILLACPVQIDTKHCIHDPIFRKIIALYSCLDFIQIIDPQGVYRRSKAHIWSSLFSERCFPSCNKLYQAKIRMNKRALTHHEFMNPIFLQLLPIIIDELQSWYEDEPPWSLPANIKRVISIEIQK